MRARLRRGGENHKEFDNKKDALAFLRKHALMSVGWTEGGKKKVAIYWNGKLHVEDAATKKIWGSKEEEVARGLVAMAKELTAGKLVLTQGSMGNQSIAAEVKEQLRGEVSLQEIAASAKRVTNVGTIGSRKIAKELGRMVNVTSQGGTEAFVSGIGRELIEVATAYVITVLSREPVEVQSGVKTVQDYLAERGYKWTG